MALFQVDNEDNADVEVDGRRSCMLSISKGFNSKETDSHV